MSLRSVVLWDVGGTLFDYAMSNDAFLRRCLKSADIDIELVKPQNIACADVFRRKSENLHRTIDDENAGNMEFATILLRNTDASPAQIERFAIAVSTYYDLYAPVPGVLNLLDEIKTDGITQGVVSNWPPSLYHFLKYHGLSSYFDVIVSSGETGVEKPDPAIFQRAFSQLNVLPADCIYIGDNPQCDIQPARELGMYAIHFNPRANYANADTHDVSKLRQLVLPLLRPRGIDYRRRAGALALDL